MALRTASKTEMHQEMTSADLATFEQVIDVRVVSASRAGGGVANEDYALSAGNVAVVLDGVTQWRGPESGCVHGTVWYVTRLAHAIIRHAEQSAEFDLKDAVNAALRSVADSHASSCDLSSPRSPAAALAVVRQRDDNLVDYLVLADCVILLDTDGGVEVFTDSRLADLDAAARAPTATVEQRRNLSNGFEDQRNQQGGYWVASSDVTAGDQALYGTVDRKKIRSIALLSDGAACLVDKYANVSWEQFLFLIDRGGPELVIDLVRKIEASDRERQRWPRAKVHDDATVVYVDDIRRLP